MNPIRRFLRSALNLQSPAPPANISGMPGMIRDEALLEAVNDANAAIGHPVFYLPMALFAKHVLFMEEDRSLSSSVLDRSVKLVAEAASGFGPQLRAIAAGSPESASRRWKTPRRRLPSSGPTR